MFIRLSDIHIFYKVIENDVLYMLSSMNFILFFNGAYGIFNHKLILCKYTRVQQNYNRKVLFLLQVSLWYNSEH